MRWRLLHVGVNSKLEKNRLQHAETTTPIWETTDKITAQSAGIRKLKFEHKGLLDQSVHSYWPDCTHDNSVILSNIDYWDSWIQVASATIDYSWKNTWLGVLKPSLFLGWLLSFFMVWINSVSVMVLKILFFGKYCRMIPLVFSLVPRSQEEYGCAK